MTYTNLEKQINRILRDKKVENKALGIIEKIKEIEETTSVYEVHMIPILDEEGNLLNKGDDIISVYGSDAKQIDESYYIFSEAKVVFTAPISLIRYIVRK